LPPTDLSSDVGDLRNPHDIISPLFIIEGEVA